MLIRQKTAANWSHVRCLHACTAGGAFTVREKRATLPPAGQDFFSGMEEIQTVLLHMDARTEERRQDGHFRCYGCFTMATLKKKRIENL